MYIEETYFMIWYASWDLEKQALKGILECKRFIWKWHLWKGKEGSRIGLSKIVELDMLKFLPPQWELQSKNYLLEEYHLSENG